jgi:hypothetical protein
MPFTDEDITLVEVDPSTGEEIVPKRGKKKSTKKPKPIMEGALAPATPLQVFLFAVSQANGFATTEERARWRRLEAKMNATDEGRMQEAWLKHCIQWGEDKNRDKPRWRKMPYTAVIAYAENEQHEQNWKQRNWEDVTKKPTVEQLKETLSKVEAAMAAYSLDED